MSKKIAPITANEMSKAWSFENKAVADKFDTHVREQLPWYEACSRFVAEVAVSFIPHGGRVFDIGASTGNITRLLADTLKAKTAETISIEPSAEMFERWNGYGTCLKIPAEDYNFADKRPDVVVMMLVLMFMPPAQRGEFLGRLMEAVLPGGAIIIVDKGYIDLPCAQVAAKAATVVEKMTAGMSPEAYVAKEMSLRGEQRPTDIKAISAMARDLGLKSQEIFRHGEFYGLLIVKPSI